MIKNSNWTDSHLLQERRLGETPSERNLLKPSARSITESHPIPHLITSLTIHCIQTTYLLTIHLHSDQHLNPSPGLASQVNAMEIGSLSAVHKMSASLLRRKDAIERERKTIGWVSRCLRNCQNRGLDLHSSRAPGALSDIR